MFNEDESLRQLEQLYPTQQAREEYVFDPIPAILVKRVIEDALPFTYTSDVMGPMYAGYTCPINVFRGQRILLADMTRKMLDNDACRYVLKQVRKNTKGAFPFSSDGKDGLVSLNVIKITHVMDGSTRRFIAHYDCSVLD